MPVYGWIIIAVVALILIIAVWFISTSNKFVRLKLNAEEAFSTMDVCMKERYDLVPNLVETVKGYMKHEKETLTSVIDCRSKALSATTPEDKAKAEGEFGQVVSKLLALTEAYPDLKANSNFMDLQSRLADLETKIANSRKYYNACVKEYNTMLLVFPSSIVANSKKLEKMSMFEITETERQNVKVSF